MLFSLSIPRFVLVPNGMIARWSPLFPVRILVPPNGTRLCLVAFISLHKRLKSARLKAIRWSDVLSCRLINLFLELLEQGICILDKWFHALRKELQ